MYEDFFADRIAFLRMQKNVSAREMSLAIGQNCSYINRIASYSTGSLKRITSQIADIITQKLRLAKPDAVFVLYSWRYQSNLFHNCSTLNDMLNIQILIQ